MHQETASPGGETPTKVWVEDAGFTKAERDTAEATQNLLSWRGRWEHGEDDWAAEVGMSAYVHSQLARAHPVVIRAEQVLVLPDVAYGEEHTMEWMRTMKLPFDPLYIGFNPPLSDPDDATLRANIRGAVCSTTHIGDAEMQDAPQGVVITPLFITAPDDELPERKIGPIGFIRPPHPDEADDSKVAVEVAPGAIRLVQSYGNDYNDAARLVARGVSNAAAAALQVLYFLESANVEIAEQEVTRQVRRAAARKGHEIASMVHVRSGGRRPAQNSDSSHHIDYEHRFEVRGHYKHFHEDTAMAKAVDDEKLIEVPGRDGRFRRVWCPPFVKGPEDKPLIPKTRKVDQ